MHKLLIEGGHTLEGSVQISGAKNSAVALIPAAILADSPVVIDNLPLFLMWSFSLNCFEKLVARLKWISR